MEQVLRIYHLCEQAMLVLWYKTENLRYTKHETKNNIICVSLLALWYKTVKQKLFRHTKHETGCDHSFLREVMLEEKSSATQCVLQ